MPLTKPQITLLTFNGGGAAGHSPADSTTYTIGANAIAAPVTTDGAYFHVMTRAGVIRRAQVLVIVGGTLASAGNTTIRARNTGSLVEEQISATLVMTAVTNTVENNGLSLPFDVGDPINIEFTTPAWATNPTAVFYNVTLEVELF